MKRIIFNLENRKNHWYDKIASGEMTVEYRRICPYWQKRLGIPSGRDSLIYKSVIVGYSIAVFRLGYSRKHQDIVRRIVKIDIGPCPYDGWDGEYFRIHFEKEEGE